MNSKEINMLNRNTAEKELTPLRYKAPYAPKVGEWWDVQYDKFKNKTGEVIEIEIFGKNTFFKIRFPEGREPIQNLLAGSITDDAPPPLISYKYEKFHEHRMEFEKRSMTRRHFRNQEERDAAPAIPPVEGAQMLLRNGEISKFIAENWVYGGYDDDYYCWNSSGISEECNNQPGILDTIAVHTWPEDVE